MTKKKMGARYHLRLNEFLAARISDKLYPAKLDIPLHYPKWEFRLSAAISSLAKLMRE